MLGTFLTSIYIWICHYLNLCGKIMGFFEVVYLASVDDMCEVTLFWG